MRIAWHIGYNKKTDTSGNRTTKHNGQDNDVTRISKQRMEKSGKNCYNRFKSNKS